MFGVGVQRDWKRLERLRKRKKVYCHSVCICTGLWFLNIFSSWLKIILIFSLLKLFFWYSLSNERTSEEGVDCANDLQRPSEEECKGNHFWICVMNFLISILLQVADHGGHLYCRLIAPSEEKFIIEGEKVVFPFNLSNVSFDLFFSFRSLINLVRTKFASLLKRLDPIRHGWSSTSLSFIQSLQSWKFQQSRNLEGLKNCEHIFSCLPSQ